jgi:hypothetical protein
MEAHKHLPMWAFRHLALVRQRHPTPAPSRLQHAPRVFRSVSTRASHVRAVQVSGLPETESVYFWR